jgi:hypothetical protein
MKVNKIIENILSDEGLQNQLVTSFRQYFQRKAYGHYYNDVNKKEKIVSWKVLLEKRLLAKNYIFTTPKVS